MSFAIATVAIWVLVALDLTRRSVVLLPANTAAVVERVGRFSTIRQPGLHFLIPYVDKLTRVHVAARRLPLGRGTYVCRDVVGLELEGTLTIELIDVPRAVYGIAELDHALVGMAFARTSAAIGLVGADVSIAQLLGISEHVRQELNLVSASWGARVLSYELGPARRPPALERRDESAVPSIGGISTSVAVPSD